MFTKKSLEFYFPFHKSGSPIIALDRNETKEYLQFLEKWISDYSGTNFFSLGTLKHLKMKNIHS